MDNKNMIEDVYVIGESNPDYIYNDRYILYSNGTYSCNREVFNLNHKFIENCKMKNFTIGKYYSFDLRCMVENSNRHSPIIWLGFREERCSSCNEGWLMWINNILECNKFCEIFGIQTED